MKRLYGRGAQLLSGLVHCLLSVGVLITQIASIGLISKKLFNMDFTMAVLFFGALVVLYSTLGGMRSVSYTDVAQLVMVLLVFFWVSQKAMSHTGGFAALVKKVASQDGDKLSFLNHPKLYIEVKGRIFYTLLSFYILMSPPVVHRMLMVKDKSTVSRTWYSSALIYGVITIMFLIIGLFGFTQKETLGLVKNKNVFIYVVKYLFKDHPRITDLIALGIIGILLSTMDSVLHTLGITVVKDVIEPLHNLLNKKGLDERKQLNYAKISILLMAFFRYGMDKILIIYKPVCFESLV